MRAGVGLHSRDKDWGYHLETYMETKDSATSPTLLRAAGEKETTGVTAEVVFAGGILISLAKESVDTFTATGAPVNELDVSIISLGWASSEGLSVVLTLVQSEGTNVEVADGDFGELSESEQVRLGVAWSF